MRLFNTRQFQTNVVLAVLVFSVLWRGGKSIDATWVLAITACVLFIGLHHCKKNDSYSAIPWSGAKGLFLLLIAIFNLWTWISLLYSSTRNYGMDEVLQTTSLSLIVLWYLVWHESDSREESEATMKIIRAIALSAIISCLIGLSVYIFQPVNRFVGTFFDVRFHTDYWPNAFAQFLLLAWPLVFLTRKCFDWRSTNLSPYAIGKSYIMYISPVALVLGCLLLTYSRGALIAFVGQIGLLTMLILKQKENVRSIRLPLMHIALALSLGGLVFMGINAARAFIHPVQGVIEKVTFHSPEGMSSINERSDFWKQSLVLAIHQPLLGWGPYSFRFVQPRLQNEVLATSDHPHNVFLKFASERGIGASLVFFTIVLLVFYYSARLAVSGKRIHIVNDSSRMGLSLIATSIAGVMAHNLIDFNLQFVGIALPLWLLFAIVIHKSNGFQHNCHFSRLRFLYAFLALLLFVVSLKEGIYLVTSSLGRHAEVRGDDNAALHWFNRSQGEWFSRDMLLSRAAIQLKQMRTQEALQSAQEYLRLNAQDSRGWKLYGDSLRELDRSEEAIQSYERAFRLGALNDVSISRKLLEALLESSYSQPTSDAAADSLRLTLDQRIQDYSPVIEKIAVDFTNAITSNVHFVALSPNSEETSKLLIILSVLHSEKSEYYKTLLRDIDTHTNYERQRSKSRNPGWLW